MWRRPISLTAATFVVAVALAGCASAPIDNGDRAVATACAQDTANPCLGTGAHPAPISSASSISSPPAPPTPGGGASVPSEVVGVTASGTPTLPSDDAVADPPVDPKLADCANQTVANEDSGIAAAQLAYHHGTWQNVVFVFPMTDSKNADCNYTEHKDAMLSPSGTAIVYYKSDLPSNEDHTLYCHGNFVMSTSVDCTNHDHEVYQISFWSIGADDHTVAFKKAYNQACMDAVRGGLANSGVYPTFNCYGNDSSAQVIDDQETHYIVTVEYYQPTDLDAPSETVVDAFTHQLHFAY